MNFEPIIKTRFKRFRDSFGVNDLTDGLAFERFVNHVILSSHQPDAFGADAELLNQVCVGGHDDMGIDGIGIKINGLLVQDKRQAMDILEKFRRINVEFIFIQSKYTNSFRTEEFGTFASGVRDFLSENHLQPRNDKINQMLEIKDYLLGEDVIAMWDSNPTVRLYYVTMGKWNDTPHLEASKIQLERDILKIRTYGECKVVIVDAELLKTICDNNENVFSASIETIDIMPLTEVKDVENSCLALCYASEFLKILSTTDGIIRKSLFDDNVRDYQGVNGINDEIKDTVENEPEKFGLLNNGITIVCESYHQSNRRISLRNPQIVNGCQTSHVLFYAQEKGQSVDKVPVQIKFIATKNPEVTNQIVRGTNRQNIVFDEAFETTKKFHKDLEEFINHIGNDYGRIYYERRSRQYQHDPRIMQIDKINLRNLTQYSIAMLLNKPHLSHRHEAKLLKDFEGRIFQDHQSRLPYFMVALAFSNMEKLFKDGKLDKKLYSFRAHILMIMRELVGGHIPSLNDEKTIDKYCKPILDVLSSSEKMENSMNNAVRIFQSASDNWVDILKKSSDGRKDIDEFTTHLLSYAKNKTKIKSNVEVEVEDDRNFGVVSRVIVDRNGVMCGFIKRNEEDVFFHRNQNKNLSFINLQGKVVAYRIERNPKNNKPVAIGVELINS